MGKIFLITAQKGGVGKTTINVHCAFQTAVRCKAKTLLIELDPQCNATNDALFPEEEDVIFKLPGADKAKASLLWSENPEIKPLTNQYGIDCIWGDGEINSFPKALAGSDKVQKGDVDELITDVVYRQMGFFKSNIAKLKAQYDYIFIDTPPSFLGLPMMSAISVADELVGILMIDKFSVSVNESFLDNVTTIMDALDNPDLNIRGFVINMFQYKSRPKALLEKWKKNYGDDLFICDEIPYAEWIKDTVNDGVPIWKNADNQSKKRAVMRYMRLFASLDLVPLRSAVNV